MAEHVAMVEVARFAEFLQSLAAGLDPDAGWYGVFSRHDPDGLRACLQGRQLPPWDVVESLLADAGAAAGPAATRARSLHGAAVAAWDAQFGSEPELSAALAAMERDLHRTDQDLREVHIALSHADTPHDHARLTQDRAWLHDDRTRLMARAGEVRERIAALRQASATASPSTDPGPQARRGGGGKTARLRGARFAGVEETAMQAPVLPTLETAPGSEPAGGAAEARGTGRA
ncbi:hypothetical protein G5C51_21560, partial [Streptomyces sp. A7024]|nr:hypothetical protein [Streptomyces coryli]